MLPETSDVSSFVERYYVYILFSRRDKGFYIGYTLNLRNRLTEHAKSQVTATRFRIPFQLIHYEYFINRKDAKAREKYLKSGYGRSQLKKALQNTLKNLL